jgi:DNA (cytosine-5)-methyltransferase 1
MPAYYNEIDRYAAQWLRNLIARGLIAPGEVDERSIVDVRPEELRGFGQYHFFAGIGGWSYALRLAGVPDDRPVWTGSCPCQPFSVAGLQRGSDDERHLWPAFYALIRECRPATVFGEQVAGTAALAWLDHVFSDLEESGYAAAAADLPACSVGAPHRRQRLYWVAKAASERCGETRTSGGRSAQRSGECSESNSMGDSDSEGHAVGAWQQRDDGPEIITAGMETVEQAGAWDDVEWLACSDGKARPTQPGIFPLAHGLSNRVGRLRAYGNAIVPQVAATFIQAVIDYAR